MIRVIATLVLATLIAGCATQSTTLEPNPEFSPAKASTSHPVQLYHYSAQLLQAGEMNQAAFWFYAGQLRYRVHLLARPDLPSDQDPALFASLNYVLGSEINGYLGGDPSEWEMVIERVLSWDAKTPNEFTPKERFPSIHQEVRSGLEEFLIWINENHAEIRKQRAANGLENR